MPKLSSLILYAVVLLTLYCGYLALLYAMQDTLVYPGTRLRERPGPQPVHDGHELVWLQTSFGAVEAWYLPPYATPAPTTGVPAVILAHGNYELIDTTPEGFLGFRERGYAVLLVEYPGYGGSAGSPSQASVSETFAVAYDTLTARPGIDAARVLALGRSLGGGAVCDLARQRSLAAVILVAAFADLPSMARGYLAPTSLVRDRYDNAAALRGYAGPVLIVHGTGDGLIPYEHAERLAAAAADRGRLISYDSDHNDCPPDFAVFWRDVDAFLRDATL
jgi:hypothetical protein